MAGINVDRLGLDDGAAIAALVRRLAPLALGQATDDAGLLLGLELSFDVSNPAVQDVLDQLALQVQDVAATTKAEIAALVGRQAAEGWDLPTLARHIQGLAETSAAGRAALIARTETARAYTAGSLLAYQDSGVVGGKRWLATDGCPICAPLDGAQVALDDSFAGGYDGPPAHPACRCAVAPILKEL